MRGRNIKSTLSQQNNNHIQVSGNSPPEKAGEENRHEIEKEEDEEYANVGIFHDTTKLQQQKKKREELH